MNCTIRVEKTKALISFAVAVTAKLICAFLFAYADCWFSHAAAQMLISIVVKSNLSDMDAAVFPVRILTGRTAVNAAVSYTNDIKLSIF